MKTTQNNVSKRDIGKKATIGYIYARLHPSYDDFNACKIGVTENLTLRDRQYATNEIVRGHFAVVFEVPLKSMKLVERDLIQDFDQFRVMVNGGVEFYSRSIIPFIGPRLKKYDIEFRQLERKNINALLVRPTYAEKVDRLEAKAKENINVLKAIAKKMFTDLK